MGRSVGRLVGGCMAVLVRRRVVDRCCVGCCSWNCFTRILAITWPFERTFLYPAPYEWAPEGILFLPHLFCCLQIPCAVDCVVGPILVNAADCCVTCCACCCPDYAESCCCVACAGGWKQFDRLHWSLWDYSPFRCCPHCSGVEPNSYWDTHDTFFGSKHC